MIKITAISLLFFALNLVEKQVPLEEEKLDGTWTLTELKGFEHTLIGNKGAPELTIQISDSTYHGHSGCNGYHGRFQLKGSTITFSPALMTKMACDDKGLEKAYMVVLDQADKYRIEGSELYLLQSDSLLAVFKR